MKIFAGTSLLLVTPIVGTRVLRWPLFTCVTLFFLLVACGKPDDSDKREMMKDMAHIRVGMSQQDVLAILGEPAMILDWDGQVRDFCKGDNTIETTDYRAVQVPIDGQEFHYRYGVIYLLRIQFDVIGQVIGTKWHQMS